ncbi:hypothetical protein PVAP13_3NG258218 [Panicum virgatum]|uniref:Uncharacterized protein n=1 Tax=Panicum virgatum TaxID=38727 RepID=A0A8T0UB16_PANVG|nr:hypothetical protein PVAP13_3NG258218 [Panicum virgatum]
MPRRSLSSRSRAALSFLRARRPPAPVFAPVSHCPRAELASAGPATGTGGSRAQEGAGRHGSRRRSSDPRRRRLRLPATELGPAAAKLGPAVGELAPASGGARTHGGGARTRTGGGARTRCSGGRARRLRSLNPRRELGPAVGARRGPQHWRDLDEREGTGGR